jgi:very-short-patch-repair endonuclease
MERILIDYNTKTKVELVALCKERGIKGYASIGSTKEKIIQLLKGEISQVKNNLFDYLTINNPSIILIYVGNSDDLKTISQGTMVHYKWKCANYLECANTFEARPRDLFRNDRKPHSIHCSACSSKEKVINCQKTMLEKNGSIQSKMQHIINIWCEDNMFKPNELTNNSHKRVKLKCPNKSAKHPNYEIYVYNIQEIYCYRCPKCYLNTSNAEIIIYSELKYSFKDVKWQQKIEDREADVIVEDLKLVIEIDGYPWHKDKMRKDLAKNAIFEKNGYSVLRIRDTKLDKITCDNIVCNISNLSIINYNKIAEWINTRFKCNIHIYNEWKNIEYYRELLSNISTIPYDNSVEYLYPESKDLWDYEKNYPLIPSNFTPGSHIEVWIKCKSGHSYKKPIHNIFRTVKDKKHMLNCPECIIPRSNKRTLQINGITYKSIIYFCKQKNIPKNRLYTKMNQSRIDITVIANIQTYIEANLDILTRK